MSMREMKKFAVLMTAALCMLFAGCNNKFARDEYDDPAKIVSSDRYAKEKSVINTNDSGFSLEIGSFDGRETVWEYTADEDGELNFTASLELSDGQAKLVFVDADNNITTLAELPEGKTASEIDPTGVGLENAAVNLKKGENRFKLVGCGAKNVKAEFSTAIEISGR